MPDREHALDRLQEENAALRRELAEARDEVVRWRSMAEHAPIFVALVDPDGAIQFLNRDLPGYAREDALRSTVYAVLPSEYHETVRDCLARVFLTGQSASFETVVAARGGAPTHCQTDIGPVVIEGRVIAAAFFSSDVSRRKRAEQALNESLDELKQIASAIPDYLWSANVGPEGQFTYRYYSPPIEQITGRSIGYYLSGPEAWLATVHPDDRARMTESAGRLLCGASADERAEYRIVRPDGEVRWVLGRTVVRALSDGSRRLYGATLDITDRKRAIEALQQSEQRLSLHFERTPLGAIEWDLEARVTRWNPAAERIFGYAAAEAMGRPANFIVPGSAHEHVATVWSTLLAGQQGVCSLNENITADGRIILCDWYNTLLVDAEGKAIGFASLCEDVTARIQAEHALQMSRDELAEKVGQRTAELVEANGQLRAIYNSMADGLVIVDIETRRFVHANETLCAMTGYTLDELRARSVPDLHPADSLERQLRAFDDHASGMRFIAENSPVRRKDGSVFYADIASSVATYRGRQCVLGIFRDTTERKLAQETLERERQSLWRMLQASDHERQVISYEIHDGLAQYLAAAGMQFQSYESLRSSDSPDAKRAYETAVELVRQAHFEARRLINEVRPPVIDETGLETAMSHLVHEQRRRGGPTITLHSDVQFGRLSPVLENSLYRIVQEALTNACAHSDSDRVAIAMTQAGGEVRLEVRDWGVGFDPEAVGGGHFGLEGIRQRVRLLGGQLQIERPTDGGTRLRVTVPVVELASGA